MASPRSWYIYLCLLIISAPLHKPMRIVAKNRKVYFDYFIERELEAGIALTGSEVKSIRQNNVNIQEAFVYFSKDRRALLINAHIKEWQEASINNHDPTRSRVILLKKAELDRWAALAQSKGYTVKPLSLYFKGHLVKLKIGLCRGKKQYDKRELLKKRDMDREMIRHTQGFNGK